MLPVYKKRREVIAKLPRFWPIVIQNNAGVLQLNESTDFPVCPRRSWETCLVQAICCCSLKPPMPANGSFYLSSDPGELD